MPVTVYDIARAAGVSRTTVQRALSGKGRINPGTKSPDPENRQGMRYRPNHSALRLTLGKSNLIGVVIFPTIFTAAQMVFEPIARTLHQSGYQIMFHTVSGFPEDVSLCLDQCSVTECQA